MAERRMFSRAIVRSDAFCSLPPTAQLLYFHVCMEADDDGFCGSLRLAMADAHATAEDLAALESAKFLLHVSGVWVVKHWRIMNTQRKDRHRPTSYQDELALLEVKPDGSYTFAECGKLGESLATKTATKAAPFTPRRLD